MNIKKHIPNAITCCNLLCGCLAIVQAFEGNLVYAAYLVGMGAIFDFFDGFAARMLKVSSPIGKDLDSLTDMVTFGVVPGVVMFQLINTSSNLPSDFDINKNHLDFIRYIGAVKLISYFAFIITIFSAIRLAKFNNDTRQTDSFIGVPTPAVALFICAIPLILNQNNHYDFILNPYILSITSVILSFLLVSEIPLFALKFKHFKWKDNEIRFVFLGLCLVMLVALQFVGIPLIIIMYILLSVINNMLSKSKAVS
jgi:CDP-diacylglycerol--serine O-phosphatidyltransferase